MKSLVSRTPLPVRLKAARKAKRISQKNLGILAGIDEFSASARMNHYEKGKHLPDYETLCRIAKILDVPVPYFYCADDLMAELLMKIGRLPKGKQRQLLTIIDNLDGASAEVATEDDHS